MGWYNSKWMWAMAVTAIATFTITIDNSDNNNSSNDNDTDEKKWTAHDTIITNARVHVQLMADCLFERSSINKIMKIIIIIITAESYQTICRAFFAISALRVWVCACVFVGLHQCICGCWLMLFFFKFRSIVRRELGFFGLSPCSTIPICFSQTAVISFPIQFQSHDCKNCRSLTTDIHRRTTFTQTHTER